MAINIPISSTKSVTYFICERKTLFCDRNFCCKEISQLGQNFYREMRILRSLGTFNTIALTHRKKRRNVYFKHFLFSNTINHL